MSTEKVPSLSDIKRAYVSIHKYTINTPILTSHSIDEMTGAQLFFKCENFQKVGSVKIRGALNAIFSLTPEERKNGFATHSSGNHAQAVAQASKIAGVPAYIVLPKDTTEVKRNAVIGYGAEVVECEPNAESRQQQCDNLIAKTKAVFIPPYDDYKIIVGQATATKELIEDTPDLDVIMTPVGGGDLSAGSALAVKYLTPKTEVILAEPALSDDTYQSFKAGKLIRPEPKGYTMAEGLRTPIGVKNFEIIKSIVKDVMTAEEDEIINAMRIIMERMKIVIESGCALPLAVILKNKDYFQGKKIGIVLSGGNVDLGSLPFS